MSEPLLINLYGGPGAGKTTTALRLTGALKAAGYEAEYVPEYARDLALEERLNVTPQFDILMEQTKRIMRTIGTGIDIVVTDSPILLQSLYSATAADRERAVVMHTALATVFDMMNFLIDNNRLSHSMVGRITSKEDAQAIDGMSMKMLVEGGYEFLRVPKEKAFDTILRCIHEECG